MTERGYWSNQVEFILACLGYAVGLGNVWRFPYLCGKNGGAAFMIPYFVTLIFAGLPLFYIELALGQFTQLTPALLYERMSPAFAGLGSCMVLSSVYTSITYNVIIAWSLHYLGNTFRGTLPWSKCDNDFNTCDCYDIRLSQECVNTTLYYRGRCREIADLNATWMEDIESCWLRNVNASHGSEQFNSTTNETYYSEYERFLPENPNDESEYDNITAMIRAIYTLGKKETPPAEYLYRRVLKKADTMDPKTFGTPDWELVLALLGAWILVFLTLLGGTKTSGKVVYFTALFPYVILFILLIRGCTLGEGVNDGIEFFVKPNITKLREGGTWGDAAQQVFFSLSLSSAGLTTIASYNRFHNNLFRDTLIVVAGNCATSIFAGFVVFPIIGHAAFIKGQDVAKVAGGGTGLVFELYPLAINNMEVPQLWCFLLFFMLVLLGIDSQMVSVETIVTAIVDVCPSLLTPCRKILVLAGVCTAGFILGLMFITPGGVHLHSIIGDYGAGYPLLFSGLTEIILVAYVYRIDNFIKDVNIMLGTHPSKIYRWFHPCSPTNVYWLANWIFFTPVVLAVIIMFLIYSEATKTEWEVGFGWFITLTCILLIPAFAIYKSVQYRKAGKPVSALFRPTKNWGPVNVDAAAEYKKGQATGHPPGQTNLGYDTTEARF